MLGMCERLSFATLDSGLKRGQKPEAALVAIKKRQFVPYGYEQGDV